ncbi:unnamed protein product [Closterium sp. NIES-54]
MAATIVLEHKIGRPRAALPCLWRCLSCRTLPCPAHRAALVVARRPPLPVASPKAAASPCRARAPPCWPPHRHALPAHRPAGRCAAMPCPRNALQAVAPPCPAHAPPYWLPPCLPVALPCPGRAPLFPSGAPPRPALRASLVLAHQPARRAVLACMLPYWSHTTLLCLLWLLSVFSPSIMRAVRSNLIHGSLTFSFARYSSPSTAVLTRLILPYLFPELSAFATVEDLITHLRTSDTRYRAALTAEFLDKNPPPMYITLYFIVTCLPDSLRAVRDHFLALDPTDLTVDLLEKHLLATETSVVTVGAARGTPRTSFFEVCSPSSLAPSYATGAAVDILGLVVAPCSCCLQSHQTLLWHHRLGHPSLPRLHGMNSRLLRATPHSSSFPPTTAPLQTLHMDVWGPARVSGQDRERYFLLVVDDYTRYTTIFRLRSKGEDLDVLIPWIRAVRLQLREQFRKDLPVLRLHSDRGGEFSFDLLQDFCRGEGILQSFTLPASPQKNGFVERRIGLVMEVACTSMIHAAAPRFSWPFAVSYAAHQLKLWPCVSLPETSPTLHWMGKVGDASVFRFPTPSGVSWVDPLPLAEPVDVTLDSCGAFGGAAFGGAEPAGADPGGAEAESAEPGGAESEGAECGGAEPEGAEPGGAEPEGAESGGAEPRGTESAGGPAVTAGARGTVGARAAGHGGARTGGSGAAGAGGVGGAGAGDPRAGGTGAGAPGSGGTGAADPGAGGTRAVDPGSGGAGAVAGGVGAGDPGAGGAGAGGNGAGGTEARDPGAGGARARGAGAGGTGAGSAGPGGACAGGAGVGGAGAGGDGAGDRGAGGAGTRGAHGHTAMDAEMASWKSTGTCVDEVPHLGANIVDGMWNFRVKQPPGSPLVFKARYVARGFSQRQGVDFFQTFSPTPEVTTLRVLLHIAAQRDYELHSLDFSTTFLQGSLHEEIWLCRPPGFPGPTMLATLGFTPSTADPSLFMRTDTSLPPFYILVYVDDLVFATTDTEALALVKSELQKRHICNDLAPPSDESVEPSGPYPELVGCLIHQPEHWEAAKRVLCCLCSTSGMRLLLGGRGSVVLTRHADASWAEIYAGAMAAQELRWLTFLLTDLGERPRSPPVPYVDNKAMIALCQEHGLEHRTKHIALRYFLARELQQRGQPPCSSPALLPLQSQPLPCIRPLSRPCPAAAHCRGPSFAAKCGPCPAAAPCRGPPLLPPKSRPCLRRPSQPLPCNRPVAALPYCRPCRGPALLPSTVSALTYTASCGPALHPPLVSTRDALPRRDAPPGTEPRHTAGPRCPSACTASAATTTTAATAATTATAASAAMASPTVLTFDAEGRAVDFDVWVDDLQLFLQCDSRDGVSLFYHTSGVSTAPAATTDSMVHSQWTTRDAVARLAVRIARFSSPATTALSRLMLPYLFPDLTAFATVADLITHLRTSDARYRAALPTEFCAKNPLPPPPMYITLYYLVTRLLDSLASDRDLFLSLCSTEVTVNLLEERLAAAEKSILAVGASCGDHRTHFFEGCSPVPLLPSVASAAYDDLVGTEEVGAASSLSGRHRNSKGKGSKGGGGDGGGGGGGGRRGGGGGGGGGGGAGSGGFSGGGGGGGGSAGGGGGSGSGGGGSGSGGGRGGGGGAGRGAAVQRGGFGGSQRQQQPRSRETPSAQQLREWYAGRGRSGGAGPCTYVLRSGGHRGETCGLPHTAHRCFGHLTDTWRAQFPTAVELPHWGDLLRQNVAIFDLDFDAILAAMYAVTDSAEGDCYLSIPPDLGIEAATLGASASAAPGTGESAAPGAGESALSSTTPTEALHTFTLDSGASRSFFRDITTLTPLSRPVTVSLADPSGGPVLAHSSTVLPCLAAPSGLLSGLHLPSFSTNLVSGNDLLEAWVDQFTLGGQPVTHCSCSRTGCHLATFTRRPGSNLYTLTTASPPVTAFGQVAASSQVFAAASKSSPESAPCSCRPLSHETLFWHHRLGHPSLPRLRGMASRTLVSGLPRSLPPLPPGPAPTCVPCVEGRQRAAPHSS